jgi:hypothetical protein
MFEHKVFIKKEVIREFDKDSKIIRERTIIQDGGVGQEEAEKQLKEAEEKLDKTTGRMDGFFKGMDKLFKDLFK